MIQLDATCGECTSGSTVFRAVIRRHAWPASARPEREGNGNFKFTLDQDTFEIQKDAFFTLLFCPFVSCNLSRLTDECLHVWNFQNLSPKGER